MKKTLLGKGIGILMSISVVVSNCGCSISLSSEGQIEKVDQTSEQQRQELENAAKKNDLSYQIDEIGSAYYLGENELLVQEFEAFLEKESISKEKILEYLRRRELYNSNSYNDEKNVLMDYFSTKEREIFENSSEEIYELYCLL